jgi:hypothetical protein
MADGSKHIVRSTAGQVIGTGVALEVHRYLLPLNWQGILLFHGTIQDIGAQARQRDLIVCDVGYEAGGGLTIVDVSLYTSAVGLGRLWTFDDPVSGTIRCLCNHTSGERAGGWWSGFGVEEELPGG